MTTDPFLVEIGLFVVAVMGALIGGVVGWTARGDWDKWQRRRDLAKRFNRLVKDLPRHKDLTRRMRKVGR